MGRYECQLSVKILTICQLSVNWLLIINEVIQLFLFYPKFSSKDPLNLNCITNSKIATLITFVFKFVVEFATSGFLSLLSCEISRCNKQTKNPRL